MKYVFAPGCALILYKPHLIEKMHEFLKTHYGDMEILLTCCRHTPQIPSGAFVINVCPGCDRRYRKNYDKPLTISLWELLSRNDAFPFPDYEARKMTIIDACPTRTQDRIHIAVRTLVEAMNISIVEPAKTKRKGTCCGDSFFGKRSKEEVINKMKSKASEMPADDVVVYCVSCCKSMFTGGKSPRYLADLLFEETTVPKTCDPEQWHGQLDEFIETRKDYETCSADKVVRLAADYATYVRRAAD